MAGLVGAGRARVPGVARKCLRSRLHRVDGCNHLSCVMSGFAAAGEPGTETLAGVSKIVFSKTLREPLAWANTQLVAQDAVEAVREMKAGESRSMRTIGSLTLCRSLLIAGLVDRFRVVVFPVITGSTGRERIYDGYPDVALDMISSRTFDGRLQLLEYVPTILSGPPQPANLGA